MKPLNILWLCLAIFFLPSCNKSSNIEPEVLDPDCWRRQDGNIVFTQLSETQITLPSKISIFFKLEDKSGKPIARLTEENFNIYEQTTSNACLQPISVFEAQRSVSPLRREFSHTTLILLDLSGSVLTNFSEELKEATKSLVNEIDPSPVTATHNIGIYWFDGSSSIHQLIAPSFDKDLIVGAIDQITGSLSQDNSTNLYGAVNEITNQANELLANNEGISGVSILLFTDGKDRANRISKQEAYQAVDNSSRAVSFFTVGLGEEINEDDLKKFGKDKFVGIQAVSDLVNTFTAIAQSVEDESNSYYFFEYCSPIRSGTDNTLIIEAVQEDRKGFLENTFNAEGFGGGCKI